MSVACDISGHDWVRLSADQMGYSSAAILTMAEAAALPPSYCKRCGRLSDPEKLRQTRVLAGVLMDNLTKLADVLRSIYLDDER